MKTKADTALRQIVAQLNYPVGISPEQARKQGYRSKDEIAKEMGCSAERARQLLRKAGMQSIKVAAGVVGQRQDWYRAK